MLQIEDIQQHLAHVEQALTRGIYVWLGWTNYAAIPLYVRLFGPQVGIVQLTRHPVTNSASLLTHNFYIDGPRHDAYTDLAILDPSCAGVIQRGYAEIWNGLSPFERCLFTWTESSLYAEELRQRLSGTDFLQVRMEDLLGSDDLSFRELTSFLGLPFRGELALSKGKVVDRYRKQTHVSFDWKQIYDHPNAVEVALGLGYEIEAVDELALKKRYSQPAWQRPLRMGFRLLPRRLQSWIRKKL
jgi:hypothetical protein